MHNIHIKRQKLKIRELALLYKTTIYGIVFDDKPNQVEFYDIDLC